MCLERDRYQGQVDHRVKRHHASPYERTREQGKMRLLLGNIRRTDQSIMGRGEKSRESAGFQSRASVLVGQRGTLE